MDKGILLLAFGKKGYLRMAYNLAFSIKHFNPLLHITVVVSDGIEGIKPHEYNVFDNVLSISKDQYTTNGRIDPAKVKARAYHIGSQFYQHTLYLDVDAVAVSDVTPLLDHCARSGKGYLTEVIDKGGKNDFVNYSMWASNANIWQWFGLQDTATLYGIQSSWAYFERDKGKALGDAAWHYFNQEFPLSMLMNKWAGTLPDELLYQGSTAKLDINPTLTGFDKRPIFFGNASGTQANDIISNYVLLSCFGNSGSKSLTKLEYMLLYDKLMKGYKAAKGEQHGYKLREYCMPDKHTNGRG